MVGHGTQFGRKKEEAIAALLSCRTVEEAARTAKVGYKTLQRWMLLPEFQAAYREARRAAFSQSIARLQQASSAAVSALLKVLVDSNAPASSRVRAADCVLNHAAKAIEMEDLEARIAELERARAESGQVAAEGGSAMSQKVGRCAALLPRIEQLEREMQAELRKRQKVTYILWLPLPFEDVPMGPQVVTIERNGKRHSRRRIKGIDDDMPPPL